jgi:hypothetical protein
MNDHEYKRRRRRIEWMLTGHSKLRDRSAWRSRGLTLTVMALSIVALLLALSNGDQQVSVLGLHGKLQAFLAWLAALTFFVTIIDLVVDWRRRAWAHANSATRLGELSVLYGRALRDTAGAWSVDGVDLAIEYERVMGSIEPIPDNKAATMKAAANRKRAVFTLLDAQPGISVRWATVIVTFRGLTGRNTQQQAPAPVDDTDDDAQPASGS